MQRRHLLQAGLAMAATAPTWSLADTWPAKPITLVVPFPPGGSTDLIARSLSTKMAEKLGPGFTFIVDNKAGATGTIGAAQVARAPADGYTFLVSSLGPFVIAPHLIKANYDAGSALGVTGTPAFFINGRMLVGAQPIDQFRELINDELSRKGVPIPKVAAGTN